MNSKATAFIIAALSSTAVSAQSSHHRAVQFGDEVVTLKFSNIPSRFGELQQLWDATNEATSPVEQERLLRIRWEDYGDTIALQSLANYHLERGDLVQAYAHFYAVHKIAQWYESVVPESHKPGPVLRKIHSNIAADVERIGKELSPSQRKTGVKLAAALIRNNPNCCTGI
ncbi:MAG TPA: hypothetical protein VFO00_06350 [Vitreimonas sp.]|nr:hypothetical protein [Vitreimonas sp.]